MWNAITAFRLKSKDKDRHIRFNSRLFEKAKLIAAQMCSGEGNSMGFRGRHHSEETKAKMRAYATGRHPSEETRRKISLAHKGKPKPWRVGRVVSEETRRKQSMAMKGRKMSNEQRQKYMSSWSQRRKPVRRFSLDGDFIDEFQCADDAAKITGTTASAIRMCCVGSNNSCAGYVFKYIEDDANG